MGVSLSPVDGRPCRADQEMEAIAAPKVAACLFIQSLRECQLPRSRKHLHFNGFYFAREVGDQKPFSRESRIGTSFEQLEPKKRLQFWARLSE